jgi:hypothetical protein
MGKETADQKIQLKKGNGKIANPTKPERQTGREEKKRKER